ncbi:MAG: FAD:protein FMN transferase [Roseovarius sp.]
MKPTGLSRRRFLSITAAGVALAGGGAAGAGAGADAGAGAGAGAGAEALYRWQGIALGAHATIALAHPDAERLVARARDEIARLEAIFSLYRPDSALARLNAAGRLADPPLELLECLSLCAAAHDITQGAFDPTVQPLWALYARRAEAGVRPGEAELRQALGAVGWAHVRTSADAISLARPGMALTLNGIAQGYIADRVAALLRAEGLRNVLVDTGEIAALGHPPGQAAWPVSLRDPEGRLVGRVRLGDRALATSAPLGTRIGAGGAGHILDPRSGLPAAPRWSLVSVTAPSAAWADALSTAGCLMARADFARAVGAVPGAAIAHLG